MMTTFSRDPWSEKTLTLAGVLLGLMSLAGTVWLIDRVGVAEALPMYAQRSGRTCGNCHASPTYEDPEGWENPELLARKCTMSCVACHTNPTGGGLRNASGRYYGQSTLGVLPTQERSYDDHDMELTTADFIWRHRNNVDKPAVDPDEDGRTIPSDEADVEAGMGQGQTGNWTAAGKPLGGPSTMALWDGRYDDLNADPLFQFGGDVRAAYWSGTNAVFPMQVDLHGSLHPVEHLTVMGTLAARGRSNGTVDGASPVFARNAFVMAHELPGMSWAKAGIFMPSYGLYGDDHTGFTRMLFEQDVSDGGDTVLGVELGTAPNYPFGTVSLFRNDSGQGTASPDGGGADPGWGLALNGGWRDLGWSLSGHAMAKQRRGEGRGDLLGAGVAWGFNPAYYLDGLPLTLLGEVDLGQRTVAGERTRFGATMVEAQYWLFNGISLRAKADHGLLDLASGGSLQQRYGLGAEVVPIPGLTLTTWGRASHSPGGGGLQPDVFVQLHGWW